MQSRHNESTLGQGADEGLYNGASSEVCVSGMQGPGFSREFASIKEFLSFARTEMACTDTSLPLARSNLSANELELTARDENVLTREMRQAAEDVILITREARISEQEMTLTMRLSDLEDSERVHLATIDALQDRITLDEDRLEQGLESVTCWTRSELEHILRERTQGIASSDKQISNRKSSLKDVHARGEQSRAKFHRARDEKIHLEEAVASLRETSASLKEENATQREALVTKERSRKDTVARCKDLEDRIKFRDETDARRDIVRQKELKELASGKEMIKSYRS